MTVQARRKLGAGGLEVSAQGLGCMGIGRRPEACPLHQGPPPRLSGSGRIKCITR